MLKGAGFFDAQTSAALQLVGYVVMPEHVHLLLSEPKKGDPSKVLQALKQAVSRALRRQEKPSHDQFSQGSADTEADTPRFWQRRFYDFNVWSAAKVKEKLEYMHANPLKRNLVQHPKEWPWSSWSYYEHGEEGLVPIDPVC